MPTDARLRKLGETICYERRVRGLSQRRFALRAGLSEDGLQGVEQGRRLDPRISTVLRIADALGMTIDEQLREPQTLEDMIRGRQLEKP